MIGKNKASANSRFAIAGGWCFLETYVLVESFGIFSNFNAENHALLVAEKRYNHV